MRKICCFILFSLFISSLQAQKKSPFSLDFGLLYDLEFVDVKRDSKSFLMKTNNSFGYELGFSHMINKKKLHWSNGIGFQLNSEKLSFYDNTNSKSALLSKEEFKNYGFFLKTKIAFTFYETESSSWNFGIGTQFLWTFNNQALKYFVHYESYTDQPSGRDYEYLKSFYSYSFGKQRSRLVIVPDVDFSAGINYKTKSIFNDRQLSLGLEWRLNFLFPDRLLRSNGNAKLFNQSGTLIAEEFYNDLSHRLAFVIGISL